MTREEAIDIVKCLAYHDVRPNEEEISMAIAALKAEPCEDAVSRQAVIAGIREYWHDEYYQRVPIIEEREDLINDVINHLPLVTPTSRWIPVDYDRYPETYPRAFQEVWMTDLYGEVRHIAYDGRRNIKAWMPYVLPEPYKEGENG